MNFDNRHNDEKGIFITNRHLSWLISALILMSFFIFMSGYFLGQKRGIEKFSKQMEQDSLADQIYSSMCALYDMNDELIDSSGDANNDDVSAEKIDPMGAIEKNDSLAMIQSLDESAKQEQTQESLSHCYYAQLFGCGALKTAEKFVRRWEEKGVNLEIQKRQSRSAKGKLCSWYQVTTARYNKKEELDFLIQRIVTQEKLQDIRIITC